MADVAITEPPPLCKDSVKNLDELFSSSRYTDMLDSCRSFNRVLLSQRRGCVPFIDQHTGLAQRDCGLWKQARERMPALKPGQVYSYPARRWVQRRRQYLYPPPSQPPRLVPEEGPLPITAVENPSYQDAVVEEETKESWYYEVEKEEDFDDNSDHSDFDYGERRRRKKAATPKRSSGGRSGGSRRRTAVDADGDEPSPSSSRRSRSSRSRQAAPPPPPAQPPLLLPEYDLPPRLSPPVQVQAPAVIVSHQVPASVSPDKKSCKPSSYCDFCLGDSTNNKKTTRPEEMVSCADCGRSGHPTCLQFTDNMIISVRKYRWQCIECKCCTLCGNSDNDEQLLFCDDCDRGYHMYCLKPPLVEPPDGTWSCSLCINEFHRPGK